MRHPPEVREWCRFLFSVEAVSAFFLLPSLSSSGKFSAKAVIAGAAPDIKHITAADVAKFATTEFLSSSPSVNTFLRCLDIMKANKVKR